MPAGTFPPSVGRSLHGDYSYLQRDGVGGGNGSGLDAEVWGKRRDPGRSVSLCFTDLLERTGEATAWGGLGGALGFLYLESFGISPLPAIVMRPPSTADRQGGAGVRPARLGTGAGVCIDKVPGSPTRRLFSSLSRWCSFWLECLCFLGADPLRRRHGRLESALLCWKRGV